MVAVAQVSPHTGTVKDDKGNPIPYATVKVKGGTQVAVADEKVCTRLMQLKMRY
jgi:hypothetical protein